MNKPALIALYRETVAIMDHLDQEQHERFVHLINLREAALAELRASGTVEEADRAIVKALMGYDESIMKRMQELRDDASKTLNKIQVSKQQKRVYDSDLIEGGSFFDKRK